MEAPLPSDELARLEALRNFAVLDTPPETDFDDIAKLAAQICGTPMALISLVDEKRQWFKAKVGVEAGETPRAQAFCAHVLVRPQEMLIVPDATKDRRFADNPLVTQERGIRFYAGSPLVTPEGHALGTLCVADHVPRELNAEQQQALAILSRQVMTQMQLRSQHREQRRMAQRLLEAQSVAKVGSWETDLTTMAVAWSEQTHKIFETDAANFRPTHQIFLAMVHPDDRAAVDTAFLAAQKQASPAVIEHRVCLPDGRIKTVEERWQVFFDPAGRPSRALGTCRDITAQKQTELERMQAEAQARELGERLTTTLESLTDGFFTLDREWKFTYVNAEAEKIFRMSRAELLGQQIWDKFPQARGTISQQEYERALRDNVAVQFDTFYPPLGIWFDARVFPSRQGLAVYFRDVTDRKRMDEATLQANETLAGIVDALQEIATIKGTAETVMTLITARAQVLTRGTGAVIELVDGDDMVYRAGSGIGAELVGQRLPRRGSLSESALQGGKALICDNTKKNRLLTCNRDDVRSIVVAPLRDGPQIIGVLKVVADKTDAFSQRDAANLQILVESLGAVIQRRRVAEQLRASEQQYRLLFAHNPHPMWVFDRETLRFLAVNETAIRHYGYTEEEFLAMTILDIRPPEDATPVHEALARMPGNGKDFGRRLHRKCDGVVMEMEVWSDGIELNGRPARLVLAHDVTERRRAETKMREQAALLDKARDAILVRGLDHRITYWNKSAERLYGWSAEEALGRIVRDLLYFDPGIFDTAMAKLMAQGEWTGELTQIRKDGTNVTVEGRWTLLRDNAGAPHSVLAINTDITERKKIEQQFLRAQRMESIGTLAGGIAHDLNNLLAPVTMGVELLRQFEPSPRSLPVIESMERSARRGVDLVKQVLSFARGVESSRVTLQAGHIIREVQSIAENTFPKNITIHTHVASDLWPVLADPTQLNQILLNLCVNARDAMPGGGRLEMSASNVTIDEQYAIMNRGVTPGRYVVVQVVDNGHGMPREIIDRIFEPFFTTKGVGQGTGLGLSTVQGIVRSHGGFVNVYSEPGKGSTFKVYLPALTDGMQAETAGATTNELARGNGELVLVVDDETSILDITAQTLQTFGYRVVTAEDGAHAVGVYATRRDEIAVVITDMMMPVMDGPALIAAIRRINPTVRIIAASGLNANANVARAANAGVKHFLAKPYSADAMLGLIKKVLNEDGSRTPFQA